MQVLSNAELNKLRNVESVLEKGLKNVLERLEGNKHFGFDITEFLEETNKSRSLESNTLKKGIQNIVISLHLKLDILKANKMEAIKDFQQFREEMVDIQDNILNTKVASKSELKKLIKLEEDLNDELNIYYNGKVAEWSEPLKVNMNCEYIPAKVKSKSTGKCKEVQQFFDFVHQSGGHENGWRKEDHLLFLKFRSKYKKIDTAAFYLHEILPDIPIEDIKSHEEWYKKYLNLQSKKKEAINRWKLNKTSKNISNKQCEYESNVENKIYKEDGAKLREKLKQWKKIKEEKLLREKEFEKQKILTRIEKERTEKQKHIELKNIVNEWRESKEIIEQTRKQNMKMYEEMEKKRRAATANKLIRQFQSMDELRILKMRQLHKKIMIEEPKRIHSGPPVPRDPNRLMKPTAQWIQRVRAMKDSINRPMPIFAAPKLAIPDWRKGIM